MTRRKPSKATARALRIERRAAEIATTVELADGGGFREDEYEGWLKHYDLDPLEGKPVDVTPRTPAEWSGWLAREIWSES